MKRVDGIWHVKITGVWIPAGTLSRAVMIAGGAQMITNSTREKWKMRLKTIKEAVEYNSIHLTDWEIGFLDSIERLLSEGKDISMQQSITLNQIYVRVGS